QARPASEAHNPSPFSEKRQKDGSAELKALSSPPFALQFRPSATSEKICCSSPEAEGADTPVQSCRFRVLPGNDSRIPPPGNAGTPSGSHGSHGERSAGSEAHLPPPAEIVLPPPES